MCPRLMGHRPMQLRLRRKFKIDRPDRSLIVRRNLIMVAPAPTLFPPGEGGGRHKNNPQIFWPLKISDPPPQACPQKFLGAPGSLRSPIHPIPL
jgi:hypothetical protein